MKEEGARGVFFQPRSKGRGSIFQVVPSGKKVAPQGVT